MPERQVLQVDLTWDREAPAVTRQALEECLGRGERPAVVLHPCGPEAPPPDRWLRLDSPERFVAWCEAALEAVGDLCSDWVTFDQPNRYVLEAYVLGRRPPGVRMATGFAIRSLDNVVAAHALAYDAIKRAQPHATVAFGTYAYVPYEIDRLVVDVLLHRSWGVTTRDLHDHLVRRRREWYQQWPRPGLGDRLVRHYTKSGVPLELAFPRAQAAVRAGRERPLDALRVAHRGLDVGRYVDAVAADGIPLRTQEVPA